MKVLCALEAVNLYNLFGDCNDLSATRGGGLAVLEIASVVAEELHAERISGGASQGLLELEGDSPDDVIGLVRKALAKLPLAGNSTIMVSAVEEGMREDFQAQHAWLRAQNRWTQMRSPSVVYPAPHRNGVCEIDLVRPATHSAGKLMLSDFTGTRREFGRKRKADLLNELLKDIYPTRFNVVSDLNELATRPDAKVGNAGDKLAVLHFDGNGFGDRISNLPKDELRDFSETRRAEQIAYFRKLVSGKPEAWLNDAGELRLEIVVFGGDEITLIVPAWLGWQALKTFYECMTGKDVTYSGGLVFCHAKAPIHAIKHLAAELTETAKNYGENHHEKKKGNFAIFQALESFDAIGQGLPDFLAERYRHLDPRGSALGLSEITILGNNMGHWHTAISKRKLYRLVIELESGKREHLDEVTLPAAVNELLDSKGGDAAGIASKIGELHKVLGDAVFLHILELWDYAGIEA